MPTRIGPSNGARWNSPPCGCWVRCASPKSPGSPSNPARPSRNKSQRFWPKGGNYSPGFGVALVEPWWSLGVALGWLCTPESMPSICLVYGSVVALGGFTSYQELENFLQDGVDARRNPAGGEFFHPLSFRRRRRVNLYRPKYIARPPSAETAPAAR